MGIPQEGTGKREPAMAWQARLFVVLIWAMFMMADSQEHQVWAGEDLGQGDLAFKGKAKAAKGKGKSKLKLALSMGPGGYHRIKNFMLSHHSHKAEVKSRIGCQNVCDQHKNCKSFSYRAGDKRCYWSEEALKYSSKFQFSMKVTKMDDMGKMKPTGEYKEFDNLMMKEKGWRKITAGRGGCRDLCNKMDKCGAFSYREFDNLCLLSGDTVKYDTDFNYYERNPIPKKKKVATKIKVEAKKATPTLKEQQKNINKTVKLIKTQAKKGIRTMKKIAKKVSSAKVGIKDAQKREDEMRDQMGKDIMERHEKAKRRETIDKMDAQAIKTVYVGRRASKEAKRKAEGKIKNAFQEGYMKAQHKNEAAYDKDRKEIDYKARESLKKHTEKIDKRAKKKEQEAKEKEKKETQAKEIKKKQQKKEAKSKAEQKVQVTDLLKFSKEHFQADTDLIRNGRVFKMKQKISEKRRKRSRGLIKKKLHWKVIQEKKAKQKEKDDKKERKHKIHHEAGVKEAQKKDIAYARKKKEQSNKEIDKKAEIWKRNKAAKEMRAKLDAAKRASAETQAKHKERNIKIGKCKERRTKGKFVTFAYAREATFTNAAAAGTKYGAATPYNGMIRVQNGLGNKKQNGYLKFSAKGNKIIDEQSESSRVLAEIASRRLLVANQVQLGQSDTVQGGWGSRRRAAPKVNMAKRSVAVMRAKELIVKGKAQYVARRRFVDRRRRWSAEKVSAARRRSVLASRRRAVIARRRRSVKALESAVTQATLRVFKFGGPASKLTVKVSLCSWKRSTISYGNAGKLSIPLKAERGLLDHVRSLVLAQMGEGEAANLGTEDTMQEGYWSRRRTAPEQNQQVLGEMKLPSKVGGKFVRRRRKPPPPPPPVVIPKPLPYVPSRRRYVDRRRRFPSPKKSPKKVTTAQAPNPTARRRRIVGKTVGSAFA